MRVVALALLASLAACARQPSGPRPAHPEPGDLMRLGAERYQRACAPCHGVDGLGDGPVASELVHRPTDLTLLAARNGGVFPREYFLAVVTGERQVPAHGTREMPVWTTRFHPTGSGATAAAAFYAQRRLDALGTYVASLQRTSPR